MWMTGDPPTRAMPAAAWSAADPDGLSRRKSSRSCSSSGPGDVRGGRSGVSALLTVSRGGGAADCAADSNDVGASPASFRNGISPPGSASSLRVASPGGSARS